MKYRLLGLALLLVAGMPGPLGAQQQSQHSAAEAMDRLMWGREPIDGSFSLIDHTGTERTEADFHGHLLLVYFGFTHCPDICPADLQAIGLAMDELGDEAEKVQPLFITLDPERDTVEDLAAYVPLFHPRLVGLTGEAEEVRRVADAFKVYFAKIPNDARSDYTVDHTAFIYVIGVEGEYLGFFPPGTSPGRIVASIRPYLALVLR